MALKISVRLADSLEIKISYRGASETLSLPVKHVTTKSILVDCADEAGWLYRKTVAQLLFEVAYQRGLEEIKKTLNDELVQVKRAGKGPTEKSGKFKVEVLRPVYSGTGQITDYERITKTLTIGWFLITEKNGEWFARCDAIIKKLDNSLILPKGKKTFVALEQMLNEVAERVRKEGEIKAADKERLMAERRAATAQKEEKAKQLEAEKEARQIETLLPKVLKEGESAIAFCVKNYTLTEMRRKLNSSGFSWDMLPSRPLTSEILTMKELQLVDSLIKISKTKIKLPDKTIEGATVKWIDWIGPSSKRIRQESECEECTVMFFGQKRVIICPDGDEITKMEGANLQIIGGVERAQ